LGLGTPPYGIFDHDDRAIDDQAEIEGAKAHQVARHVEYAHQHRREQHRQGNDRGDEQGATPVPQQQNEDHDDEPGAFEEVPPDSTDGAIDELRAIVEGHHLDTLRQRALDRLDALLDALHHGPRIFSEQHDRDAGDDFTVPLRCDGALSQRSP
jgi:hypothetical protein